MSKSYPLFVEVDGDRVKCGIIYVSDDGSTRVELRDDYVCITQVDGEFVLAKNIEMRKCENEECTKSFPYTRDGKTQAWNNGWYLQKYAGPVWCPSHIPEWVPSSFVRLEG